MKNTTKQILLTLALAAVLLHGKAELYIMVPNTASSIAALSTNFYQLYGDLTGNYTNGNFGTYVDCTHARKVNFQVYGYFANTGPGTSNVVVRVASSVDLNLWNSNQFSITIAVPGNSTNWCYGLASFDKWTPNYYPYYSARTFENPNLTVTGTNIGVKAVTFDRPTL